LVEDASKYLGETVTQAVITVPAYFNDSQRQAPKMLDALLALKCCGLSTTFTSAYGFDKKQQVSSFDLGGTFDVSILEVRRRV